MFMIDKGAKPIGLRKRADRFMPFLQELGPLVQNGAVTATWRRLRHSYYPRRGETFNAHCNYRSLDGCFRCLRCTKCSLGSFLREFSRFEGAVNIDAYRDFWARAYPKVVFDPKMDGWAYVLEKIR